MAEYQGNFQIAFLKFLLDRVRAKSTVSTPVFPPTTAARKKQIEHPKYIVMIVAAIQSLKERSGSSRQAVLKYIMANYKLGKDMTKVKYHLNKTLVSAAVKAGTLQQVKGTGACGSFRIRKKAAAKVKPKKQATKPVATAKKTLAKR